MAASMRVRGCAFFVIKWLSARHTRFAPCRRLCSDDRSKGGLNENKSHSRRKSLKSTGSNESTPRNELVDAAEDAAAAMSDNPEAQSRIAADLLGKLTPAEAVTKPTVPSIAALFAGMTIKSTQRTQDGQLKGLNMMEDIIGKEDRRGRMQDRLSRGMESQTRIGEYSRVRGGSYLSGRSRGRGGPTNIGRFNQEKGSTENYGRSIQDERTSEKYSSSRRDEGSGSSYARHRQYDRIGADDRGRQGERRGQNYGRSQRFERSRHEDGIVQDSGSSENRRIGRAPGERKAQARESIAIFSLPPLDILANQDDIKQISSVAGSALQETKKSIFDKVNEGERRLAVRFPWSNYFLEMAEWTHQGRVWTYPIDNEHDHPEHDVPFYEHVFLEKHLKGFPDLLPVRDFMKLVVTGLQQNPHMTVQMKRDHIAWYREYFNEKKSLVEEFVESARIQEQEQKAEELKMANVS